MGTQMRSCRIVPPEINTSRQVFFTDYRTDENQPTIRKTATDP